MIFFSLHSLSLVPASHSIFYLLPVQGNLVIARQHVIINIPSAEERSELQPKIFVCSHLPGPFCSCILRDADVQQRVPAQDATRQMDDQGLGKPGASWASHPASCPIGCSGFVASCPLVLAAGQRVAPCLVQHLGVWIINIGPQKKAFAI